MIGQAISYTQKFNGKGELYQNGTVVKETEKAVLAYFYFAGQLRDYNFAVWFPKSRIVKIGENNHFTANLHYFQPTSKSFHNQGELTPDKVCSLCSTK